MLQLDRKLLAVLAGKERPASPQETVELASQSTYREQYRAATRFYTDAFQQDPRLADSWALHHRYNAAGCAALAAAGKGKDAASLNEPERASLRGQAHGWLRFDLTAQATFLDKTPKSAFLVRYCMAHWKKDAELASVRDEKSLAALPEAERKLWQQLWADVAALLKKAETLK
jgi:hypothetical protein